MQNLNSDQLRRQLDENNAAMNTLADDNEKIVELLSLRGLKAINSSSDLAEIRALLEPERRADTPLTTDELKAGGWRCADVSEECRLAFAEKGIIARAGWSSEDRYKYCYLSGVVIVRSSMRPCESSLKQIHRVGNEFYWGAP